MAINKTTGRVEAVGTEAKKMLGRTPGNIIAIKPMKDGVIADFEVTEKMLAYFIKKAHNRTVLVRPRIIVGVPSEITQVEKRAVRDSAYRAKASEVHLVEEAMAAAIGAGMPITEPSGNMIIDIGGGTTDIAVISLAGIVYNKAVRVAGNEMDESIIQYVKKRHNLLIGERTAEQVKMQIGSAYPLDEELSVEIKGRHLIDGLPKVITITSTEVREALTGPLNVIVDAVLIDREGPKSFTNMWHPDGILAQGDFDEEGSHWVRSWPERIPIRDEYWTNRHERELLVQFLGNRDKYSQVRSIDRRFNPSTAFPHNSLIRARSLAARRRTRRAGAQRNSPKQTAK